MTMHEAGAPLRADDEPPPFEIYNPDGPAPLVLLCDHASGFIPRALGALGLDEAQLARHIALDIGIAEVTRRLAQHLDAPAVLSGFSRLIVDPNRGFDDPTLIPQISDGVVVPGNRELTSAARQARLEAFYEPYHAAVAGVLDARQASLRGPSEGPQRGPAVISMHSFTPVMKGSERPWQIGVLWNRDPRLPQPLMAKLHAAGVVVGDNEPYSGRDGHGHTLHIHAEPRGFANVLIEVRQDLIDTHHGAIDWAERLGAVLSELVSDPGLYFVEHFEERA